tara:strand:+ start:297 stop:581 length:285 start_codon:yes stop_codon:yes gene_type:complete
MMNVMKFNWRTLPVQAQAVLLVGAISIAFLLMQMAGVRGEKRQFSAMVLGVSLLAVAISTYNINCLISGKCTSWATLLAVAYVISQGTALLSMA